MKLYNSPFSPNAKRVRVCAKELGVALEIIDVDFGKGEHRAQAYLAKNPMGKIPTFEDDDGWVLWESPAILIYLAQKNPHKGLLPDEPRRHAEVMRWMFWNAIHFEAHVFVVAFERLVKPTLLKQVTDEHRVTSAFKELERYAPILNGQLDGRPWLLGEQLTIADIDIGTTAETAARVGLDLGKHPALAAWLERLQDRESWK